MKDVDFPVVTCNVDSSGEPLLEDLYEPYVQINVGGEKIGIIGYTTASTQKLVDPGLNSHLANY